MASDKKKTTKRSTVQALSALLGTTPSLLRILDHLEGLSTQLRLLRMFLAIPESKDMAVHDIHAAVRKLKAMAALNDAIEEILNRPGFQNASVQLVLSKNGAQYKATLVAKERVKDQVYQPFTDVIVQRELKSVDLDSRIEPSLLGAIKRLKGGE